MIKSILAVLITMMFIGFLLLAVVEMPAMGSEDAITGNVVMEKYIEASMKDTGATNIVSAIILDYRAFDTFVEATVIFTALIFVRVVFSGGRDKDEY